MVLNITIWKYYYQNNVKRIVIQNIIEKTEIYNYYNDQIKVIDKMPDGIDIIYDNVRKKWITKASELTQDKIKELNKYIGDNKSSIDLALVDEKGAKVLIGGKNYNLKDAFDGKYKKVLVING